MASSVSLLSTSELSELMLIPQIWFAVAYSLSWSLSESLIITDSELFSLLSLKLMSSDSDFRLLSQKDPSVSIGSSLYQRCVFFAALFHELSVLGDEASPLRGYCKYDQSVDDASLMHWDHSQLNIKALLLLRSDAYRIIDVIDCIDPILKENVVYICFSSVPF